MPSSPETSPQIPVAPATDDLTEILKDVQLPERKDFRAAADTMPASARTSVAPEESREMVSEVRPPVKEGIAAVHTLKDDLQSAVHDKNLSLVQAAALEQDKLAHAEQIVMPQKPVHFRPRAIGTLAVSGALVFLGFLALSAVALIIKDRSGIAGDGFIVDGLIFAEQTIPFPAQKYSTTELKRLIAEARASSGTALGVITRLTPVVGEWNEDLLVTEERSASTREFFASIGAHIPDELQRALGNDMFFGFHTVDENAPVMILPVTSYERAFAGMLAWEKTMNADLAPIYTSLPPLMYNADGLLVERSFEDLVMRNYDTRALKDDAGIVQLYYSFPTRDLLIIAESPYSFAEILARLRAERRL
jgi:hypothetical protein